MSELRDRVLEFLRENPGSTTTSVRQAVSGSSSRVRSALAELEKAGEIANRGNGRGHAWRPAERRYSPFDVPKEHLPESAPEVLEGVPVACWMTPTAAAECFNTTPRTIGRWEGKGLPSFGDGRTKVLPMPHAMWWTIEFSIAKEQAGNGVTRLPLGMAMSRFNEHEIENGHRSIYTRTRGAA